MAALVRDMLNYKYYKDVSGDKQTVEKFIEAQIIGEKKVAPNKYVHFFKVWLCALGVRHSLVVMFTAIRLQGLWFKPRPGQKFETRFLFHAHPCSASGTTTSGSMASPKPGNSQKKVSKWRVNRWVHIHQSQRNNTNEIQWQVKKSEWKNTKMWWTRAKAQDTRARVLSVWKLTWWGSEGTLDIYGCWAHGAVDK